MPDLKVNHFNKDAEGNAFKELLDNAESEGFEHLRDANYSPSNITDIFTVSDGEVTLGMSACIVPRNHYQITVKGIDILDEHRGAGGLPVSETLLRGVCDYARENVWEESRRNSIIFSDFGIDHYPFLAEKIKEVGKDYPEAKRVYVDAHGHDHNVNNDFDM